MSLLLESMNPKHLDALFYRRIGRTISDFQMQPCQWCGEGGLRTTPKSTIPSPYFVCSSTKLQVRLVLHNSNVLFTVIYWFEFRYTTSALHLTPHSKHVRQLTAKSAPVWHQSYCRLRASVLSSRSAIANVSRKWSFLPTVRINIGNLAADRI